MSERTEAQREYDRRYERDSRTGAAITIRLSVDQIAWLSDNRRAGESWAAVIKRLSGLSGIGEPRATQK